MRSQNAVLRLQHRPEGRIQDSDLEVCKEPMPTIKDGQMLVKNIYLSLDPTHRIWMSDIPQYAPSVELGDVMRSLGVGKIVESKNEDYPVGTYVSAMSGVCEYCVGIPNVTVFYPIDMRSGLPLSAHASVLSLVIGLTAWYGTRKLLDVKEDDVVLVSGASGAVGSLVGQLSKVTGARVIGVAGGAAKCQNLKDLGFDVAIDYKSQDVDAEIKKAAPDGITCYFDNVGGATTEAALANFRNCGRFALCGSISEYEDKWAGIKNFNMLLMRRVALKGFIGTDHVEYKQEAFEEIGTLLAEGKLKYDVDIRKVGLDKYVDSLNALFDGKNTGKLLLQISEE